MRRLRIASLIGDLPFGGSQNRLLSFSRHIDKARFEHVVITLYRREERHQQQVGSLHQAFADAGVEVIDLGEQPRVRILPSLTPARVARAGRTLERLVRRLCRTIRERRIELIDAQHATATLFGVLAGTLTRRPTTVTQYFPTYFDRRGMRLLGQAVYARADAFICDSKAHSDLINRWLFRPHRRTRVIPNGVPVPVATRTNAEMRRLLDIPPDRSVKVVGQVSRLIPYKGQRVLLKAAREVPFPGARDLLPAHWVSQRRSGLRRFSEGGCPRTRYHRSTANRELAGIHRRHLGSDRRPRPRLAPRLPSDRHHRGDVAREAGSRHERGRRRGAGDARGDRPRGPDERSGRARLAEW